MRHRSTCSVLVAALTVLLCSSCGKQASHSPTAPNPPASGPSVVPTVPVPAFATSQLPATSDTITVGVSDLLDYFAPTVNQIRQVSTAGAPVWITDPYAPRPLVLVCGGTLLAITADASQSDETYLSQRPRLLHQRYWSRVGDPTNLTPGASYGFQRSVTSGKAIADATLLRWSNMLGGTIESGWTAGDAGGFAGLIDTKFLHTDHYSELQYVALHADSTRSIACSGQCPSGRVGIDAVWQLVDRFTITDADGTPIHRWTNPNVTLPEVVTLELPSGVVHEELTLFVATPVARR